MKPVDYVVVERIVCQRVPEVFKRDATFESVYQLNNLMENSHIGWNDIKMVYQMCEVRQPMDGRKKKPIEVIGLYLQGQDGKNDYKYMKGLNFLVPVRNVYSEMVEFMKGGWNS